MHKVKNNTDVRQMIIQRTHTHKFSDGKLTGLKDRILSMP